MIRITALALVLLGAPLSVLAQTNSADPLLAAKDRLVAAEEKILASQKAAEKAALTRYGLTLDKVVESGRAQGNVPTVSAGNKEKERLQKEGNVPDTGASELIEPIFKARTTYWQEMQRIGADAAQQRVTLLNQYVAHLKGLAKAYLQDKRDADAERVQAELDRADFVLADVQSKLPPPAPAPSNTVPAVAGRPVASPPPKFPSGGAFNLKTNLTVDLGDGVTMEFVLIPAGSFMMGSENIPDAQPVHKVKISKPFHMGKYEVTQEQWDRVMGSSPSRFKGPKKPVEMVAWDQCQEFLTKLREKAPSYTFALPTEAQWEYACRAGSTTEYGYGDGDASLGEYAWYNRNSGSTTHPVGEKKPNAWGLYDMHGNAWEWCQDWRGSYTDGIATDPSGPSSGSHRVLRGGSWGSSVPARCRSAYRLSDVPSYSYCGLGFRVVLLWR